MCVEPADEAEKNERMEIEDWYIDAITAAQKILELSQQKATKSQPTKQDFTSILFSLPNLSLSSITSDASGFQTNQTIENVISVQKTNPHALLYDRRDSLRDTASLVVANFHDPQYVIHTTRSDSYHASLNSSSDLNFPSSSVAKSSWDSNQISQTVITTCNAPEHSTSRTTASILQCRTISRQSTEARAYKPFVRAITEEHTNASRSTFDDLAGSKQSCNIMSVELSATSSAKTILPEPTRSATLSPVQMSAKPRLITWPLVLRIRLLDSLRLEKVHNSNEIIPETMVNTDGGRYDVYILHRQRFPVFWTGGSTECHGSDPLFDYCSARLTASWDNSTDTGSRSRVTKGGLDEFHSEDGEPETVNHVLFLIHDIGSVHSPIIYRTASEQRIAKGVEVLSISRHTSFQSKGTGIDRKPQTTTLDNIPTLQHFTNDIFFYTSPIYRQTIMDAIGANYYNATSGSEHYY
ncbi:hypothetical protein K0M31_008938 [Melipona bicolor]|uniref:Uncharacterized protein n=1 Tax=Melipona bicolor TaxID=60889 RepID=A0AA40FQY4_9HYME|nr:hypothetical protein K0M31_008938 [Melipona bicolor]